MDTTPEYQKMCEKLPEEMRKDHKYEEGDWFVYEDIGKRYVGTIGGYSEDLCDGGCGCCSNDVEPLFPLWRQDQLQELMYTPKPVGLKPNYHIFWLIDNFHEEVLYDSYYSCFDTKEQVLLAFVMKKKFKKLWDAPNGEWVKF